MLNIAKQNKISVPTDQIPKEITFTRVSISQAECINAQNQYLTYHFFLDTRCPMSRKKNIIQFNYTFVVSKGILIRVRDFLGDIFRESDTPEKTLSNLQKWIYHGQSLIHTEGVSLVFLIKHDLFETDPKTLVTQYLLAEAKLILEALLPGVILKSRKKLECL